MYYSGLFENFGYGKEIRLNGMGNWLLKRERAFFTRVNDNLKQQNDGYIRSGLIGCGCTFLQQCAAYAWLILRTMQGGISVGSFTMYVSAVTAFASALRTVLDNLTRKRYLGAAGCEPDVKARRQAGRCRRKRGWQNHLCKAAHQAV